MLHRNTVILSVLLFILNHRINGQLCHREAIFKKVPPDGLQVLTLPFAKRTVSSRFLCTQECVVTTGCNSYLFKKKASSNNCLLLMNDKGKQLSDNTDVVIYKRHSDPAKAQTCEDDPCENGGTCVNTCAPPYYHCRCDPSIAEGERCEHSLVCVDADWIVSFDGTGHSNCPDNYLLTGIYRAGGDLLYALDKGRCCPPRMIYVQEPLICNQADWWNTFGTGIWTQCPAGAFIAGFYRSAYSHDISQLQEARCCKPVNGANHYGPCYNHDVGLSFDNWWQWAKCDQPQYYMVAIRSGACQDLACIDEIACCQIAPLP